VLKTLVERCLELRWRREDHRQNLKRLEREIAEARAFQQSLLPERQALVNGVSIACRYTPCSALGGDLCDYTDAASGRTALLVADVSGHGLSAAMLTGIVKSAFQAARADGFEPAAVVRRVAIGLAAFSFERFVTLVAGVIAPDDDSFRYVNAGHPPIAVWGATRTPLWLESTGPLVSPALPAATWEVRSIAMHRGDQLLLYSDGVSDLLADSDGRAEASITSAIDRATGGGGALLDTLIGDVRNKLAGEPQPDDLTLLTASIVR
jgi:sigma-B regulation protein RsbU (phosphoserine phosphatase)